MAPHCKPYRQRPEPACHADNRASGHCPNPATGELLTRPGPHKDFDTPHFLDERYFNALVGLNSKVVELLAGSDLNYEPARLLAPPRPGFAGLRWIGIFWKHARIRPANWANIFIAGTWGELLQSLIKTLFLGHDLASQR